MKHIVYILFFFIILNLTAFSQGPCDGTGGQPEFYIHLMDNPGANYRLYAEKHGNTPIYDHSLHPTTLYNTQWDFVDDEGNPISFFAGSGGYTSNKGFDWVEVPNYGQGCKQSCKRCLHLPNSG